MQYKNTLLCVMLVYGEGGDLQLFISISDLSLHREAKGYILIYAINSRSSFEKLEYLRQSILRTGLQNPICALFGNKSDISVEREISREEGAAMARNFRCEFMEGSAKTGLNVDGCFHKLVRTLRAGSARPLLAAPAAATKDGKKCLLM